MALTLLITGATSGIGEAIALKFAAGGYRIILCGRRAERLDDLSAKLKHTGSPEVLPLTFDIRVREEVDEAIHSLPETWRQIDLLVNNAGLALGLNRIQEGETDDWDAMIDTNLKGLLYITRIVSRWMVSAGSGHIINIGSIAGKEVYLNGNVYCATKFAVDALTRGMRLDLLEHGIRVTQIAPGAVETEFSEVRFKGDTERARKVYEGYMPLKGEDIAEIAWFAARQPSHVNISDILVTPSAQGSAGVIFRKP